MESVILIASLAALIYYLLHRKFKLQLTTPGLKVATISGIAVSSFVIGERGFLYDRNWMVIEADTNTFLTQRDYPKMALIETAIEGNKIVLTAPEMERIEFPLTGVTTDENDEIAQREVTVFKKKCTGIDEGPELADWFSKYLGADCRLVRYHSGRDINPSFELENAPNSLGFSDEFPFLLISEASVADLAASLDGDVITKKNFRPNIIVKDTEGAWKEEEWKELYIGRVKLSSPKPCKRCILTTVSPEEGTMSETKEPFKSIFKKKNERGMFGITLMHNSDALGQSLYIGMDVNVTETRVPKMEKPKEEKEKVDKPNEERAVETVDVENSNVSATTTDAANTD